MRSSKPLEGAFGGFGGFDSHALPYRKAVMRDAVVILNPTAGRGRAARLKERIVPAARRSGFSIDLRITKAAGHEVDLAAEAGGEKWPIVVALGGDGTVHGVANGLLESQSVHSVLGHLPLGTGNDFAGMLGFRRQRIDRGFAQLASGVERRFDVGRAVGEYFVNGLGFGFGPAVLRQMESLRTLQGFPLYLAAAFRTFFDFSPPELTIVADGFRDRGLIMMAEVAIGQTAGGGFRLTPDASPCDGLFDVCLVRMVGMLQFIRYLPRVLRGTHTALPPVSMLRASRVSVSAEANHSMVIHLDGELRAVSAPKIEAEIVPAALRVICASSS